MISEKKAYDISSTLWMILFFPMHAFSWVLPVMGEIGWIASECIAIVIIFCWTSPLWIRSIKQKVLNTQKAVNEQKKPNIQINSIGGLTICPDGGELSIKK